MTPHVARNPDGSLIVDARGPRFGAAITTVVLAVALVVQGPVGVALVGWQFAAFFVSTVFGLAWSPYGNLFRFVKRRFDLGAPTEVEAEGPPRFAQACGLAVASVALVAFAIAGSAAAVGWVAVAVVLTLSTLLATTGICVGCELYLVQARLRGGAA